MLYEAPLVCVASTGALYLMTGGRTTTSFSGFCIKTDQITINSDFLSYAAVNYLKLLYK